MIPVKLKKCPMCGHSARVWHTANDMYYVACMGDKCLVGTIKSESMEKVIESWNRRVGENEQQE